MAIALPPRVKRGLVFAFVAFLVTSQVGALAAPSASDGAVPSADLVALAGNGGGGNGPPAEQPGNGPPAEQPGNGPPAEQPGNGPTEVGPPEETPGNGPGEEGPPEETPGNGPGEQGPPPESPGPPVEIPGNGVGPGEQAPPAEKPGVGPGRPTEVPGVGPGEQGPPAEKPGRGSGRPAPHPGNGAGPPTGRPGNGPPVWVSFDAVDLEALEVDLGAAVILMDVEMAPAVPGAAPAGTRFERLSESLPPGVGDVVAAPVVIFEVLFEALASTSQSLIVPGIAMLIGMGLPAVRRRRDLIEDALAGDELEAR